MPILLFYRHITKKSSFHYKNKILSLGKKAGDVKNKNVSN